MKPRFTNIVGHDNLKGVEMKKNLSYLLFSFLIIFVAACSPDTEKSNASEYDSETLTVELRADAGNGEVKLDWAFLPKADRYNIYWIADTEGKYSTSNKPSSAIMRTGTKIDGIITAPYTVTGLTNGTKYWFALSGSKEGQLESYLTLAMYSTPINPAPLPAPGNFRANVDGLTSITVFWDDVPAASGYIAYWTTVYEDLSWDSQNSGKLPEGQNSFTFTSLIEDYSYLFFVQAIDGDDSTSSGDSSASLSYIATTTETPPPNAPTNPAVTNQGNGDIIISWDTMTGATAYNIYIAQAKGVFKETGGVTAYPTPDPTPTQAATASLTNGTYYIVVTAVNSNGESAESREVSVEITDNP
jgi:hypothetical protein